MPRGGKYRAAQHTQATAMNEIRFDDGKLDQPPATLKRCSAPGRTTCVRVRAVGLWVQGPARSLTAAGLTQEQRQQDHRGRICKSSARTRDASSCRGEAIGRKLARGRWGGLDQRQERAAFPRVGAACHGRLGGGGTGGGGGGAARWGRGPVSAGQRPPRNSAKAASQARPAKIMNPS